MRGLKLEWKKLKENNLFKVLGAAYLVCLPLFFLGVTKFTEQGEFETPFDPMSFFSFPEIWWTMGYTGNWIMFFSMGLFGAYIITSEYSYRTLRQNIITGMTRSEWLGNKISFIAVLAVVASLYYIICSLLFGYYFTENASVTAGNILQHFSLYAMMTFGYGIIATFFGVLLKRTGLAIFILYVYIIFIEPIWRWVAHRYLIGVEYMGAYPANAIEDLYPVPLLRVLNETQAPAQNQPASIILESQDAFFIVFIYSLIFIAISHWILGKRDI